MAAPSSTVWGSIVGSYGKIGIYKSLSSTSTKTTVTVDVWFWSKYSVSDTNNTLYYDNLSESGSATTSKGSVSINTTVDSGGGWSESNQVKIASYSHEYTRGTSAVTRYLYAKLASIDRVGGTMAASTTFSIPKLDSYTVSYNANGGSGAPSAQTKWYGKTLVLSTTKPTRTGYTFQGWGTSSSDTSVDYAAGANYTDNASITLYAIWKANTYTVSYNANGGSGAPASQTKTYGVTLALSSTKPTRTNYTFKGWGTSSSATTVSYAAGANYTANASIKLYAIWELSYTKPRVKNVSLSRCDSEGVKSDDGTNAAVAFDWYTDLEVSSVAIQWKLASSSTWDETNIFTVESSGTSGAVSQVFGSDGFNTENSYNVQIIVADSNGSTTANLTIQGTAFSVDYLAGGKGVAFGKPAEIEDCMESAFWGKFLQYIESHYSDLAFRHIHPNTGSCVMFGVGAGGVNKGVYDRDNEQWMLYKNSSGDIGIGPTVDGNKVIYRPYFRKGDSFSATLRTAGYVTNSGKDVSFYLFTAKPIIGKPTVTVTSVDGFTLRQGNNYTHGSTATTFAIPDTYIASANDICGVSIVARFSDVTNVINNDSIGIYWTGTITFS